MASEVDICNLALTTFGQTASIDSLDPPDGSAEAEYCVRFYPIARDAALEAHWWPFATKRATLAQMVNDRPDWAYRYAAPADMVKPQAVLASGYGNDEDEGAAFQWEAGSLYTDEADAVLRYTFRLRDTTKFTPLFVIGLSTMLAGYLVGPMAKDPTGATQLKLMQLAQRQLGDAAVSAANATRRRATFASTARRSR